MPEDGGYLITDYKTAARADAEIRPEVRAQLELYGVLALETGVISATDVTSA
jgi:hypothetical protein